MGHDVDLGVNHGVELRVLPRVHFHIASEVQGGSAGLGGPSCDGARVEVAQTFSDLVEGGPWADWGGMARKKSEVPIGMDGFEDFLGYVYVGIR